MSEVRYAGHHVSPDDPRKKSMIVRFIMQLEGKNPKDAADILGISKAYYQNKLHRNCFTMDDFIKICDSLDYNLYIEGNGIRICVSEILKEDENV